MWFKQSTLPRSLPQTAPVPQSDVFYRDGWVLDRSRLTANDRQCLFKTLT